MGIHNRFFIKVIRLPVETILLLLTKNKNLSEKKNILKLCCMVSKIHNSYQKTKFNKFSTLFW